SVQVPLRIGGHVVRVPEVAQLGPLLAEVTEDAERLPVQDPYVAVAEIRHVEVFLLRICRKREPARGRGALVLPVDEHLRLILAVEREHLNTAVAPIGNIDESVIRDPNGVDDAPLLRARAFKIARRRRGAAAPCRDDAERRAPERAPEGLAHTG